ncbi:MAG: hypothetical protein JWR69_474 [Pedosphaera sp.]|nr:hypothetical protein [Pedosphaera sp.]
MAQIRRVDSTTMSMPNPPLAPSNLVPAILFSLVVWRMYRRMRSTIGPQLLRPRRIIFRIGIFGVLGVLIGIAVLNHSSLLIGFGTGLLLGVPLAVIGLRLTRFATTAEGPFYTPNTYIGVALSVLLCARLIYRLTALYAFSHSPDQPSHIPLGSPLTLALFGLLASYYITYNAGVYLRSREPQLVPDKTDA